MANVATKVSFHLFVSTNHFSGPGRAIDLVCVSVCVALDFSALMSAPAIFHLALFAVFQCMIVVLSRYFVYIKPWFHVKIKLF